MNSKSNNRRRTRSRNQKSRFFSSKQGQVRPIRRSFKKKENTSSKSKLNERRRLKIQNLNKEFQNTELKKLFEPFGTLIRCGINFNKMGQSKGTADIEFSTHEECENAINKLDNAEIDGVKVRVKYADFGPRITKRRIINSLSKRRRNIREINRENRRNRIGNKRIINRKRMQNNSVGTVSRRRRTFRRALGRERK